YYSDHHWIRGEIFRRARDAVDLTERRPGGGAGVGHWTTDPAAAAPPYWGRTHLIRRIVRSGRASLAICAGTRMVGSFHAHQLCDPGVAAWVPARTRCLGGANPHQSGQCHRCLRVCLRSGLGSERNWPRHGSSRLCWRGGWGLSPLEELWIKNPGDAVERADRLLATAPVDSSQ